MGEDFCALDFCTGVPADTSEEAKQAGCRQKNLFLGRLDGEGAGAQHAARCENHTNPQCAGRPQRVQRKRNAEQAVEVDHVWRGVVRRATQLLEPPCMGDGGAIGDLDAVAHVGDSVVNDVEGARAAGFGAALLWSSKDEKGCAFDFAELAEDILASRE